MSESQGKVVITIGITILLCGLLIFAFGLLSEAGRGSEMVWLWDEFYHRSSICIFGGLLSLIGSAITTWSILSTPKATNSH
jgi:hypothetical protein